eukprot:1986585-Amphidinium_carterae.1
MRYCSSNRVGANRTQAGLGSGFPSGSVLPGQLPVLSRHLASDGVSLLAQLAKCTLAQSVRPRLHWQHDMCRCLACYSTKSLEEEPKLIVV